MAVTLRSQKDPAYVLHLTQQAWYGILELADLYGWTPLAALEHDAWHDLAIPLTGYDAGDGWDGYAELPLERSRPVILEDALNLADALEQAFYEYEPLRVPPSYYLFEPDSEHLRLRPSIGAIRAVTELCQQGAFWVEPFERR